MAERIASRRPRQLRLAAARRRTPLADTLVIRWKCPRCRTLHIDRAERQTWASPADPRRPGVWKRAHTLVVTTDCCGEGWCYLVTPFPAALAAAEAEAHCV